MTDDVYDYERSLSQVAAALNELEQKENARWSFDGMSGAFKFSDEFPAKSKFANENDELLFPTVNVCRKLWAFRLSLVRTCPRRDLASIWARILELAPGWPGFALDRRSSQMAHVAEECERLEKELSAGLDRLDQKIRANQRRRKREN